MAFDVAIEGIKEFAQSGAGPVADFFKHWFGVDVLDMKASAAADGAGAAGTESAESYEVADAFSPILSPDQWPGDAVKNPREYLTYLLTKLDADQRALEDWYAEVLKRQPIVWTEAGPVVADTGANEAIQDLIQLKKEIESSRSGIFPPSQAKLSEFYNRLFAIRQSGGAA